MVSPFFVVWAKAMTLRRLKAARLTWFPFSRFGAT
jgi:hypothetical protein